MTISRSDRHRSSLTSTHSSLMNAGSFWGDFHHRSHLLPRIVARSRGFVHGGGGRLGQVKTGKGGWGKDVLLNHTHGILFGHWSFVLPPRRHQHATCSRGYYTGNSNLRSGILFGGRSLLRRNIDHV